MKKIRVLVVGLGNMGLSHARAYQTIAEFEIIGLCTRGIDARHDVKNEFPGVALFSDYAAALAATGPANDVLAGLYAGLVRSPLALKSA